MGATPVWVRQGFNSKEEQRQYRRSEYGTNSRRQQPRGKDFNRPRVWSEQEETEVLSFIDTFMLALDREAGREGSHARDAHQAFLYEEGEVVELSLGGETHTVKIAQRWSASDRLRYRLKFASGMTAMVTQAQLGKIIRKPVDTLVTLLMPAPIIVWTPPCTAIVLYTGAA